MSNVSSQVAAAHLEFIQPIAAALSPSTSGHGSMLANPPAPEAIIAHYRENGWHDLCDAIECRLADQPAGEIALDEEDEMILAAIDRAVAEPGWLERAVATAETEAAEQVAALILAATWGEGDALAVLDEMRETAEAAGMTGSSAHAFVAMVEGERDLDRLREAHPNAQGGLVDATHAALCRRERDTE
ncbi:MAG: hypothetical protein JXJ30_00630 [Halothiobacillaceae bacterium]|nr:hypothetical protein [Halothiobacillaceae bacterium]HER34729.1 hypothetical protein [Halothiobacillaceae bacterium]